MNFSVSCVFKAKASGASNHPKVCVESPRSQELYGHFFLYFPITSRCTYVLNLVILANAILRDRKLSSKGVDPRGCALECNKFLVYFYCSRKNV